VELSICNFMLLLLVNLVIVIFVTLIVWQTQCDTEKEVEVVDGLWIIIRKTLVHRM